MKFTKVFALIGAFALIALLPQAKADEWNQKTVFTFSGPVEIPGQVLEPGTYVFKLLDSLADRNIVEVYNKRENHLYGIFLAIPDYRMRPSGHPIITFEERATGAPQAVKAWFYPGDNYGHDFVYPKVKAEELAQANNQPVPSMPNEMASNTTHATANTNEPHVMAMKNAPLKAEQPNRQETEIATAFPPAPAPQTPAPTPATPPQELPKTGSFLPLIGLLGIASLGAAATLRAVTAKMK